MSSRTKVSKRFKVGGRVVTVSAYDSVGPEDCMSVLLRGTLHQKVTGEQIVEPIPRNVKDWIIRTNLLDS